MRFYKLIILCKLIHIEVCLSGHISAKIHIYINIYIYIYFENYAGFSSNKITIIGFYNKVMDQARGYNASPSIWVSDDSALIDEKVQIRVTGLDPEQEVCNFFQAVVL